MIILMPGNCFWVSSLVTLVIIGIGYVVLANALRSSRAMSIVGTAIASLIFISAVALFCYWCIYDGYIMSQWTLRYDTYRVYKGSSVNVKVEAMRDEEIQKILKEAVKRPGMRAWMIDLMENDISRPER